MKKVLIILATMVGVIALGNVLIAGAQNKGGQFNPATASTTVNYTGNYSSTLPYGRWNRGTYTGTVPFGRNRGTYTDTVPFGGRTVANQLGQVEQKVLDAVSQKLGMSPTDLLTTLRNGQTLTQLAQSKNVALSDLQSAADAARKSALDDLIRQSVITQQQEDSILAREQDLRILGFGGLPGFGFGGGLRGHMPFGMPKGFMPGNGLHRFGFPGGPKPQQPSATPPSNQS